MVVIVVDGSENDADKHQHLPSSLLACLLHSQTNDVGGGRDGGGGVVVVVVLEPVRGHCVLFNHVV